MVFKMLALTRLISSAAQRFDHDKQTIELVMKDDT
jgi:hypothetical protein